MLHQPICQEPIGGGHGGDSNPASANTYNQQLSTFNSQFRIIKVGDHQPLNGG